MDAKKSLIALCVFSILMGGVWEAAVANKADKEGDSVRRWGRWAVLAPAGGQDDVGGFTTIAATNDLGSCQSSENCPKISQVDEPVEPPVEPPQPPEVKSPCEAGMPCGFARIDYPRDVSEQTPPEGGSDVVPFELTLDEEGDTVAFVVNPGEEGEIQSDTVPALIRPEVVTTYRGSPSDLRGSITRNGDGDPAQIQGPWRHTDIADDETPIVNGGEYVWGLTATNAELQALMSELGGDTIAVYQGMTMGITAGNEGTVRMEVNFDDKTWNGHFDGNVEFDAAGDVIGSGFVSDADGFSDNIAKGEVKGGFVNAGQNAIGGYKVVDVNGLRDADVFNARLQNRVEN